MATNLLSAENCSKVLQNRFQNTDVQFINFEMKPISENVEGFMGEHYNLFVTYKINNTTNTEQFFIKVKPSSEMQIEMCNECKAYKKEIFLYDTLIKEFNKYGYDTSFATKSYLCESEKFLILDNLVLQGYELSEKQTMFDLNKIKCSVKALAMFHAAGFAYQQTKSKELESFNLGTEFAEYFEEVFFVFYTNPDHFCMSWWKSTFAKMNKLIDFLPESEEYKIEFKKIFNNYPYGKVFVDKTKLAKTCGHGDLWSNNMMFKYDNNVPVECKLLDFQFCRYFYPCFDVLLVIFANTSASLRETHLNELFEYYYKILGDTLEKYGHSVQNILPKEDFYESIRITKVDAMLHVLSAFAVHYLPAVTLANVVEKGQESGDNDLFNTAVCCDAFKNDAKYRKIMSDFLREMREALLERQ